ETYANPNWSEGNQFVYVENFTATGVSVETKFNDHVDAQFRVINGWDQVVDNNTHKSLMARVGLYPDALTSLGIVGYWGPHEAGSALRPLDDASVQRQERPGHSRSGCGVLVLTSRVEAPARGAVARASTLR